MDNTYQHIHTYQYKHPNAHTITALPNHAYPEWIPSENFDGFGTGRCSLYGLPTTTYKLYDTVNLQLQIYYVYYCLIDCRLIYLCDFIRGTCQVLSC